MTCNSLNFPNIPDLTCRDFAPDVELRGDEIWINGAYRGHVISINGPVLTLEYKGDNKYMKDQKITMHVGIEVAEMLKDLAL